jgi:hypothetical protein
MLGSRKPLNRSHTPGTLDAAPSGIDCSALASCRHLCNRPALAPVLKLLGHETARMTSRTSHLIAPSERPRRYAVHTHQVVRLNASLPREMAKRPRGQADDAADDRWANICPAWRQSV